MILKLLKYGLGIIVTISFVLYFFNSFLPQKDHNQATTSLMPSQLDQNYERQQKIIKEQAAALALHEQDCKRIANASQYKWWNGHNILVEKGKVFTSYNNNVFEYCGYLADLEKEIMLTAYGIPNKCPRGTYLYEACQLTPQNTRYLYKIENDNLVAYHQYMDDMNSKVNKIVFERK